MYLTPFLANVLLDVLLERAEQLAAFRRIWEAVEGGLVHGVVPAHGFTTIFYLARQQRDRDFATQVVRKLLQVFEVAPISGAVLREAAELGFRDFEDAVCAAAGRSSGCEVIVTRDRTGFAGSPLAVLDPEGALALIGQSH